MRVEGEGIFFWVGGAQCAIERGGWNEREGLVSYFQAGGGTICTRRKKKFFLITKKIRSLSAQLKFRSYCESFLIFCA